MFSGDRSPIDNIPALVQVMTWRRTGDKSIPGPMMTQFIDAYMQHCISMQVCPEVSEQHGQLWGFCYSGVYNDQLDSYYLTPEEQ